MRPVATLRRPARPSTSLGRNGAFAILLLAAFAADAAPLRLAVVYGHNGGTAAHAPLRFAEADAARVAATLIEVGGVKSDDLKLLQGQPRAQLEAALHWAAARIATAHRTPGAQAILTVYVSSHGDDGRGLELGAETLPWADLKAALTATRADVRIAFVDACNASGLLEVSGRPSAAFQLDAEDRLTVGGEAFITSSAANEPSLEAGAYKGSVFTHHLVAALRGAGDRSGDGLVSLEEAYRYAYARTVEGESGQHPGYGFKLAGYGELIVSSPKTAGATLMLPRNLEALTLADVESGNRFLELRQPEGRLLALPPGRWQLEVWRDGKARVGRLTLIAGERATLDESTLTDPGTTSAQLVRLGATTGFCLGRVRAVRDPPLAQRLAVALGKRPSGCGPGSPSAELELVRERTLGVRVTGHVGSRTIDLHTDETALIFDVWRALTNP